MPRAKKKPQEVARLGSYHLLPVGDLRPYERNARLHPPAQIDQIVRSIQGAKAPRKRRK